MQCKVTRKAFATIVLKIDFFLVCIYCLEISYKNTAKCCTNNPNKRFWSAGLWWGGAIQTAGFGVQWPKYNIKSLSCTLRLFFLLLAFNKKSSIGLMKSSGPSWSKLTMSLVNNSLKFTWSDTQICWNFLLKKMWVAFAHIFFQQKISEYCILNLLKQLMKWPIMAR